MYPQVEIAKVPLLPIALFRASPSRIVTVHGAGRGARSGAGLSGVILTTRDSLVAVPTGTLACPFVLACSSSDHQGITVSGTAIFLVADPKKLGGAFDFSVSMGGVYLSEDPEKLIDRLQEILAAVVFSAVGRKPLTEALSAQDALTAEVESTLLTNPALEKIGVALSSLAITMIQPSPDIAKALEALRAEELKRGADSAIHDRQMAAELQSRRLKQEQILTTKSVEEGERQVLETQMETEKRKSFLRREVQEIDLGNDRALQDHQRAQARLTAESEAEIARVNGLVVTENAKSTVEMGEAQGAALRAFVDALKDLPPKTVQSLALQGGHAGQTIAAAFLELAEKAGTIGSLNITPDLLESLVRQPKDRN
jgi:hypothetical protein